MPRVMTLDGLSSLGQWESQKHIVQNMAGRGDGKEKSFTGSRCGPEEARMIPNYR